MRKVTLLLTVILPAVLSGSVWAWGQTGHRVVAEIAERHLSPMAKERVHKILAPDSMAVVATWADDMYNHPDQDYYGKFKSWHFLEMSPGQSYESSEHHSHGDVVTGIAQARKTLQDQKATLSQQQEALKLLIHLVGDAHQPLHIGNGLDRGANLCKIKWQGRTMDLHALWDTDLIASTEWSMSELADKLSARITLEQKASWGSVPVMEWVSESQRLHAKIYPDRVTEKSPPFAGRPYCATIRDPRMEVPDEVIPQLSYQYRFRVMPILEEQLAKAGIRLAAALSAN